MSDLAAIAAVAAAQFGSALGTAVAANAGLIAASIVGSGILVVDSLVERRLIFKGAWSKAVWAAIKQPFQAVATSVATNLLGKFGGAKAALRRRREQRAAKKAATSAHRNLHGKP